MKTRAIELQIILRKIVRCLFVIKLLVTVVRAAASILLE